MTYLTALTLFGLITLAYLLIEVGFTDAHFGKSYGFPSNRPADANKSALGLRKNRGCGSWDQPRCVRPPISPEFHSSASLPGAWAGYPPR